MDSLEEWLLSSSDLTQAQFNVPFEERPEEGSPVVGYRVAYTITHPDTGETVYKSPLTYHREGTLKRDEYSMVQALGQSWERDDLMRSTIPVHNPKSSDEGFYYFADRTQAEEYMKMIATGKVHVKDNDTPFNAPFKAEYEDAPLMLTLSRVTGTADSFSEYTDDAAHRREGLRMKNMQIHEPVLQIPVEDIANVGAKYRDTGFTPSTSQEQTLKKLSDLYT